ncbi:hypothetical protein M514_04421 [Trichuris suis]|uniref:Uncharacterized protein n=1 Tax=Trichuris suis TaxID=68888 RepID=A0A085MZ55_9BILA|nr:hypothetical protein M513_04421 [Trichuris suis]KFD62501.1 hypothetical protein M514_04421 [Trichuris suis]
MRGRVKEKPRITETADTETADTEVLLYLYNVMPRDDNAGRRRVQVCSQDLRRRPAGMRDLGGRQFLRRWRGTVAGVVSSQAAEVDGLLPCHVRDLRRRAVSAETGSRVSIGDAEDDGVVIRFPEGRRQTKWALSRPGGRIAPAARKRCPDARRGSASSDAVCSVMAHQGVW